MKPVVQLEKDRHLALAIVDDGKVNAVSHALIDQMNAALDTIERDDSARALVISGRDGVFSAGFDLRVMRGEPAGRAALLRAGAELALRLYEWPRPVVMACTGHAIAMGAILLHAADWRTGAHGDFRITMNEVSIGMTMPHFAAELARDRLSARYYTRAVVGAELFSPATAVDAGYLDEAVDALSVLDFACVQADRLAQLDPLAFAATRRRTRQDTIDRIRSRLAADLAGLVHPD